MDATERIYNDQPHVNKYKEREGPKSHKKLVKKEQLTNSQIPIKERAKKLRASAPTSVNC